MNNFKNYIGKFLVVFALIFGLITIQGCEDTTTDPSPIDTNSYSHIRFIQASYNAGTFDDPTGAANVDIFINNVRVVNNLTYGYQTGFITNPPTAKFIKVLTDSCHITITDGSDSTIILSQFSPVLQKDRRYTVVMPGSVSDWNTPPYQSKLIVTTDTTAAPVSNRMWLRPLQAYNSNGFYGDPTIINVYGSSDPNFTPPSGDILAIGLEYLHVGNYFDVPSGNYTIKITPTTNPVFVIASLTINGTSGSTYSIVPNGFAEISPGPSILEFLDTGNN